MMPSSSASDLRRLVGWAAVLFPSVYFASDLLEVVQGDFTTLRLSLTYVGESALPLVLLGLYAVQRPQIGRLGLAGAVAFAYAYVFFTSTVVYALVDGTRDYDEVTRVFGWAMTLHGAVLVAGGLCFGLGVVRAGVLPSWTGRCLVVGVVLVAAASGSSNTVRTIAAAFPDAALIGMGVAALRLDGGPRADRTKAPAREATTTPG